MGVEYAAYKWEAFVVFVAKIGQTTYRKPTQSSRESRDRPPSQGLTRSQRLGNVS